MPHVVIEEAGDLQGLYQVFTPIIHRAGSEILKVQEIRGYETPTAIADTIARALALMGENDLVVSLVDDVPGVIEQIRSVTSGAQ